MEAILQVFARMEKREKRREQALERIGTKGEVGTRSEIKEEPPATPEVELPAMVGNMFLLIHSWSFKIVHIVLTCSVVVFRCSAVDGAGKGGGGSEGSQGQPEQAEEELLSQPNTHWAAETANTHGQRLLRSTAGVPRRCYRNPADGRNAGRGDGSGA